MFCDCGYFLDIFTLFLCTVYLGLFFLIVVEGKYSVICDFSWTSSILIFLSPLSPTSRSFAVCVSSAVWLLTLLPVLNLCTISSLL